MTSAAHADDAARGRGDDTGSRRRNRRDPLIIAPPAFVPMTEEQRQAAVAALSRLFAALLSDEDFMAFVDQRRRNVQSNLDDRHSRLLSGEESS